MPTDASASDGFIVAPIDTRKHLVVCLAHHAETASEESLRAFASRVETADMTVRALDAYFAPLADHVAELTELTERNLDALKTRDFERARKLESHEGRIAAIERALREATDPARLVRELARNWEPPAERNGHGHGKGVQP